MPKRPPLSADQQQFLMGIIRQAGAVETEFGQQPTAVEIPQRLLKRYQLTEEIIQMSGNRGQRILVILVDRDDDQISFLLPGGG